MENNIDDIKSPEKQLLSNSGGIGLFAMKTGIILILILILANALLPDFSELKRLETPKSKLFLLSFVQNPQALLKISEIEEGEGKIDNAIRETELAIGLLEMHGADKLVIQRYFDRLNKLKKSVGNMATTQPNNNHMPLYKE